MSYKVFELECRRCGHIWTTRPTMINKNENGIPRICPNCKKYLRTKNLASYKILRHITTWGGELTELSDNDNYSKFKKPRKPKTDNESPEFKPNKPKQKKQKEPSNDFFEF